MSRWKLKVNGKMMDVEIEESIVGHYYVKVNGQEHKVVVDEADWGLSITPLESTIPYGMALEAVPAAPIHPFAPMRKFTVSAKPARTTKPALPPESPAAVPKLPPAQPPPAVALSGKTVPSPMPGKIIKVLVSVGDEVKAGDGICILESMKMENTITSPMGGRISALYIKEGDNPNTGSPLADIE